MQSSADEVKRGITLPGYSEMLRKTVPRPVLHAARNSVRTYGTLSAASRPLPSYLIIGTKKGGTTSLINWLINHPHVARMYPAAQKLKSAHYFDINYHRGVSWYRSHFPSDRALRAQSDRVDGRVIVGEASPYYMFHPVAAARARATLPQAKVIAILRDPVSRAYSNYWDRRATGTEDLLTFEAALDAEHRRVSSIDRLRLETDPTYYSFDHDNHTYLARGRYLEHLSTWLREFPPEQVLILQAERMFKKPQEVFVEVQRFLNIPTIGVIPLEKFNERPHEPMLDTTRNRLVEYYRPYNAQLYEALGQNFAWESRYQQ